MIVVMIWTAAVVGGSDGAALNSRQSATSRLLAGRIPLLSAALVAQNAKQMAFALLVQ